MKHFNLNLKKARHWFGIIIIGALVATSTLNSGLLRGSAHASIVSIAQGEIGSGEAGANNRGPDIKKYFRGKEGSSWCAAFVSYCLYQNDIKEFGYLTLARGYINEAKKKNMVVKNPQPGDLIVFWRKSLNDWRGHVGIVENVKNGKVYTIEGNVGKFPAKVRRFEYALDNVPRLLGYVRLETKQNKKV